MYLCIHLQWDMLGNKVTGTCTEEVNANGETVGFFMTDSTKVPKYFPDEAFHFYCSDPVGKFI